MALHLSPLCFFTILSTNRTKGTPLFSAWKDRYAYICNYANTILIKVAHIPIFHAQLGIKTLLGLILELNVGGVMKTLIFFNTRSGDRIIYTLCTHSAEYTRIIQISSERILFTSDSSTQYKHFSLAESCGRGLAWTHHSEPQMLEEMPPESKPCKPRGLGTSGNPRPSLQVNIFFAPTWCVVFMNEQTTVYKGEGKRKRE